jgi:alanine dehydrogenase
MSSAPEWIDATAVAARLKYGDCMTAVAGALRAYSARHAAQPLRTVLPLPDGRGTLYVMPAALPPSAGGGVAVKLISIFPGNHGTAVPSHQGVVVVFDEATGSVRALLDAAALTAIRTAAVSAVATDLLARRDARVLALLGSGVQAGSHLDALLRVRDFDEVRVWSRRAEHAERFAAGLGNAGGPRLRAVESAEAAVRGADVVCTLTASPEPVLLGDWLAPGAHVNAVGASRPDARELDTAAVARASVWVDSEESAGREAGDLLLAAADGADVRLVGELGALLNGAVRGRADAREITLFESLGLAVEDAAAAAVVLRGG